MKCDYINMQKLYDALRIMGKEQVMSSYRGKWTSEKPTTGYCYVVAEVVYHYLAPDGSHPFRMETGEGKSHWFIKDSEGNIIDLTADQFDEPIDYSQAKPANFRTKHISKRGRVLAELLGLI